MPPLKKLSILIACYNEERLIIQVLKKIDSMQLIDATEKEVIIVDDASTDNSYGTIKAYLADNSSLQWQLFRLEKNSGKGACIRTALEKATGDFIVIQDADLEYDPNDYNKMIKPILDGYADVVYGSRFRGSEAHRVLFFFHTIGNRFLTFLSNLFTQINLTDMETGYKMFKAEVLKKIRLRENRFGFEPEITAKISRIKEIRIYEVGISYYGRNYEEGKKIKWIDGFRAIYCIFKYNIFRKL